MAPNKRNTPALAAARAPSVFMYHQRYAFVNNTAVLSWRTDSFFRSQHGSPKNLKKVQKDLAGTCLSDASASSERATVPAPLHARPLRADGRVHPRDARAHERCPQHRCVRGAAAGGAPTRRAPARCSGLLRRQLVPFPEAPACAPSRAHDAPHPRCQSTSSTRLARGATGGRPRGLCRGVCEVARGQCWAAARRGKRRRAWRAQGTHPTPDSPV